MADDRNAPLLVPLVRALPGTVMARVIAGRDDEHPDFGHPLLAMLDADVEPMALTPLLRDFAEPLIDTVLLHDSFYTPWLGVVQPFMSDALHTRSVVLPLIRRVLPSIIAADIIGAQPMTPPTGQVASFKTRYDSDPEDTTIRVTKTTFEMETFDGSWQPLGADNPIRRWASVRLGLIERGCNHEPFLDLLDAVMPETVGKTARQEFSRRMVVW